MLLENKSKFANNHFLVFLVMSLLMWMLPNLFMLIVWLIVTQPWTNPQKHTASRLQHLIVIIWQECGWMWVGFIIWTALSVNQTLPHVLPRDCSHWSGPIVLTWLQAKPEAGHLSSTWSYQLLRHCYGMPCVCVCFSIFVGSQNWKPTYGLGSDNIVGTKMLNLIMQIINF